jgi:rhodanese-related sulfurtransferase
MDEPPRVTPAEVYAEVQSGKTLLVCAYEEEAKFRQMRLQGAISFAELKSRLPGLPKDREIVFYCA